MSDTVEHRCSIRPASSLKGAVAWRLLNGHLVNRRGAEFFGVLPLLAVGVLALNDHFLKAAFHNTLTGKLSDFAGCFFLPLYVSAMLALATRWDLEQRLWAGVAVTLLIFIPVSVSRPAADFVARSVELIAIPLGIGAQRIASDPTDLIAVPMIFLAVLYAQRVNRCVALPS